MEIRVNDVTERSPCLGDGEGVNIKMLKAKRRVLLDVLMACWGLSTWLGVNGFFVQLPLLVERLPERWTLPSNMTVAVQAANVGILVYVVSKRLMPRLPDSCYIYVLLTIAPLALILNAFLYAETVVIGNTERSVAFLVLTFFAGFVGCTSSVLFYPYLRHFRDIYLATYLMGEGLSGFIPSVLALIQGVGGEPECVPSADNSTIEAHYPPPRFGTDVFLSILGCFALASLLSFLLLDKSKYFVSEKVVTSTPEADKENEAIQPVSLLKPRWISMFVLIMFLTAVAVGVLPSIQSYSCMPYGARVYHLAVTLSTIANPTACLAGVWLRPAPPRLLAALLCAATVPLAYMLATALMSPTPPLLNLVIGEALIVISWVCATALVSYGRMWAMAHCRAGGARGMRACGALAQAGAVLGSLAMYALVNYSRLFTQPDACPPRSSS